MSRVPWHLRHFRAVLYVVFAVSAVGVGVVCAMDDPLTPWIGGRQLYGLWALGLLLTSMLIGPLTSVFRPFPFLGYLILGRRAVGISCFVFALLHAGSYIGVPLGEGGVAQLVSEARAEGALGVAGLVIGAVLLAALAVLTATSFDHMLVKLGRKWKTVQNAVYLLLPMALVHAVLLGADFGFHQAKGVTGEPDIGALLGMSSLSAAWFVLFILRRRGVRTNIGPWLGRFRGSPAPRRPGIGW